MKSHPNPYNNDAPRFELSDLGYAVVTVIGFGTLVLGLLLMGLAS